MFWYWFVSLVSIVAVAVFAGSLYVGYTRGRSKALRAAEQSRAMREFTLRREHLEAAFLDAAAETGMPRGLAWADVEFGSDVAFARDRETGGLRAFCEMTIRFEAIAGGGMEEVEAVSNLRAATAVFHYEDNRWKTDGRAVFNLTPDETIERFQNELEMSE